MEIIQDNFGNPWKLNEPSGKFELLYVETCWVGSHKHGEYRHFGSYETYDDAIAAMYDNFHHEDDRVYIFCPNGCRP